MIIACPRCKNSFTAEPVCVDGPSRCLTCEPQDASVLDFLWQFPRSAETAEVVQMGDWFIMPSERCIVAVHDDAWPTMYQSELVADINEESHPAACWYFDRVLNQPAPYETKIGLGRLSDACAEDGSTRFFNDGVDVANSLLFDLLDYAFADFKHGKRVKVAFVEVGVRFEIEGRVLVVGTSPVSRPTTVFGLDVVKADIEDTGKLLDSLDALLS